MSADEKGQTETPERTEEDKKDTPELSEEGKEKVERMQAAYDDDRETVALPGTDNTITGVAITEWLYDDGNPKCGKDEQQKKDQEHKDEKKDDEQKDAN